MVAPGSCSIKDNRGCRIGGGATVRASMTGYKRSVNLGFADKKRLIRVGGVVFDSLVHLMKGGTQACRESETAKNAQVECGAQGGGLER